MIRIIANGFGVLSTLCFIFSFQIKSNKALYITQAIGNVFYGLQFWLLGATGGLFNMGMQTLRNLLMLKYNDWKWMHWKGCAPLFCVPSFVYMILTWTGPLQILPFIAFSVACLAYWTNSAKLIRLSEIACVSPAWLIYDLIEGAYGGILTELVILGAVIVSIVRFGWKGLDDPEFRE